MTKPVAEIDPESPKAIKARTKAKALRDYKLGHSLEEIGIRYGFAPATISCWAARAGIARRPQGCRKKDWPDEIDIAVVNAVKQVVDGKPTLAEIGDRWRMSRANVHRIYHRWKNWKSRNPFKVGEIIRFMKRDYEVLEPAPFRGKVRDLRTNEKLAIHWRCDGRWAVKL